ncbi:MAG: hypothetical protein KA419_01470 [Acidobacteria bacterium]|nr:hypothetical protein [Acidobacteriota bacterium]
MSRVAVTGTGLVTALGPDVAGNAAGVVAGRTGLAADLPGVLPPWAGCVGRVPGVGIPEDLPPRQRAQAKFLNRGGTLAYLGAREAMAGAPDAAAVPPHRRSLYAATGDHSSAGCEFLHEACREASGGRFDRLDPAALNQALLEKVNPFFLLESIHNNPFSFLTAAFACMGPGTSLAAHSPAGGNALELAFRTVRAGRADLALVSASGSWIDPVTLYELDRLGLLSAAREGSRSFRPFDARRDGFLAGEGAAGLLLEPEPAARARGAEILALMEGVGNAVDGSENLAPSARGLREAVAQALDDAGCTAADLGLVVAHGSGTVRGDAAELEALLELLGERAPAVPVAAFKPFTGHMGAASDVAEVILGIHCLRDRHAPGIPGFRRAPRGFEALALSAAPRPVSLPRLLSVGCGLGGQVSAVVVALPGAGS